MFGRFFVLFSFLSIAFIGFDSFQEEKCSAWVKVRESNGISVFTRDNSLSNTKEVKAVSKFKTSLSALVYLIKDTENQPNWAYKVLKSEEVKTFSDFHWIAYTVSDTPWPMMDRDNVTDVTLTQYKDKSIVIYSHTVDGIVKLNKDYVRIPFIKASWHFVPLKDGYIEVSFQILIKMGGSIPEWVVNMFIEKGPYQTIDHMRKEAIKPKYREIKLNYIK